MGQQRAEVCPSSIEGDGSQLLAMLEGEDEEGATGGSVPVRATKRARHLFTPPFWRNRLTPGNTAARHHPTRGAFSSSSRAGVCPVPRGPDFERP